MLSVDWVHLCHVIHTVPGEWNQTLTWQGFSSYIFRDLIYDLRSCAPSRSYCTRTLSNVALRLKSGFYWQMQCQATVWLQVLD